MRKLPPECGWVKRPEPRWSQWGWRRRNKCRRRVSGHPAGLPLLINMETEVSSVSPCLVV